MNAVEILDQCETTGTRRIKVKDPEIILRVSPGGQVEVENPAKESETRPIWGVYALKSQPITGQSQKNATVQLIGWKYTEKAASALVKDLTSLGVTCYYEQISAEPPSSVQ